MDLVAEAEEANLGLVVVEALRLDLLVAEVVEEAGRQDLVEVEALWLVQEEVKE